MSRITYKLNIMVSLAQKLPSCLALFSACCIVLVCILVFRPEPWQKVLIKHINIEQSVQILEPHQEYSNQSPAKSILRETAVKRGGINGRKASYIPIKSKHQVQPKLKLREQYQADSIIWNNPNDFWNITYEERSKVSTQLSGVHVFSDNKLGCVIAVTVSEAAGGGIL